MENGQIMDLDEWKERLTALGYERTAQVDGMGQFSIPWRYRGHFPADRGSAGAY